nr:hypothetical protein CFP56_34880 [Quercus suber]
MGCDVILQQQCWGRPRWRGRKSSGTDFVACDERSLLAAGATAQDANSNLCSLQVLPEAVTTKRSCPLLILSSVVLPTTSHPMPHIRRDASCNGQQNQRLACRR